MSVLVICEKNNAALRIAYILSGGKTRQRRISGVPVYCFERDGREYRVVGLRGHIISLDFPTEYKNWKSVSPRELIDITPVKHIANPAIIRALRSLMPEAEEMIIATDYDREGELIGTEVLEVLHPEVPVKRARFSALTKEEITRAFDELHEIDLNLASAAETRQVVDLIWGVTLTRFLSLSSNQMRKDFLSVGRVQSPTLALIVEREEEIENFVPTPFWEIQADYSTEPEFRGYHESGRITDPEEASEIYSRVRGAKTGVVRSVKRERKRDGRPPPFSTTTFLAAASTLGITAHSAMEIAERLYTQGYISYPRTDNTVYPRSLNLYTVLRKLRSSPFRAEVEEVLSQDRILPSRGRTETTDHPPIYPTEAATRDRVKGEDWKIYELVVRRFLATLAPDGELEVTTVNVDIRGEAFISEGTEQVSEGWRRYYPYLKVKEVPLPQLSEGQQVPVRRVLRVEKKTRPPRPYTQGTLIQKMEALGLGTKSTRHEIIKKLYDRRYVRGRHPRPTDIGKAVVKALKKHAETITKAEMTSELEKEMSHVARGNKSMREVVEDSKRMLHRVFDVLEEKELHIGSEIKNSIEKSMSVKCPKCGEGRMVVRRSKKGKRFLACNRYPDCDHTYPLPQKGKLELTKRRCRVCGAPIVRIITKGRKPWELCTNMDCPSKKEE